MTLRSWALALLTTFAAVVAGGTAADDRKDPPAKDTGEFTDADFVRKAASGGMFEVESSKLAAKQATSGDVKKFADMMVKDHQAANKELMSAAETLKIRVEAGMTRDHQAMLDKLGTSKAFDADYMDAQVKAHDEAVELFTRASKEAKDATLKEWAGKKLPALKEHQKMAKDVQASLKK